MCAPSAPGWTGCSHILIDYICGAYCSVLMLRYGDNIRKIWLLSRFEQSRSLPQVLEFFHRVYPHTQQGDSKRLVLIHHRAELASAGYPDGLESDSSSSSSSGAEEDEEEEESEDEGDEELVSLDDPQEEEELVSNGEDSAVEVEAPSSDEEEEEEEDVRVELVEAPVIATNNSSSSGRVSDRQAARRIQSQQSEQDENSVDRVAAEKRKRGGESLSQPAVRSSGRTKR